MEKKSDIFSELKKEVAKKDVKISSDELKLESEKIQKESTSATSAVFETHKHEEEKLLKQKKML